MHSLRVRGANRANQETDIIGQAPNCRPGSEEPVVEPEGACLSYGQETALVGGQIFIVTSLKKLFLQDIVFCVLTVSKRP